MKFIHIGDLHIGVKPAYMNANEIMDVFTQVIRKCNEGNVDLLLIAGDLFNKPPKTEELDEVNYILSKLKSTKVVIVAGNHDYVSVDSGYQGYEWCDNVTFLMGNMKKHQADNVYFEDINTRVYGFSYQGEYNEEIKRYPIYNDVKILDGAKNLGEISILLGHGGDAYNIPVDFNMIWKNGFDYAAFGHIHKPQIMDGGAYSGSLVPLNRTETGTHGYIEGAFEDGELTILHKEIGKHRFIEADIVATGESVRGSIEDEMEKFIRKNGIDNYYIFNICGKRREYTDLSFDDVVLAKADEVSHGGIVKINDMTSIEFDYDQICADNENNIIGRFIRNMDKISADEKLKKLALEYGVGALLMAKCEEGIQDGN